MKPKIESIQKTNNETVFDPGIYDGTDLYDSASSYYDGDNIIYVDPYVGFGELSINVAKGTTDPMQNLKPSGEVVS